MRDVADILKAAADAQVAMDDVVEDLLELYEVECERRRDADRAAARAGAEAGRLRVEVARLEEIVARLEAGEAA